MSTEYYHNIVKAKRQKAKLMACQQGAPQDARRVDSMAYWVDVKSDTNAVLHLRKWTMQGKCKRKQLKVTAGGKIDLEGYAFHWDSLSLYPEGEAVAEVQHWAGLRARSTVAFAGEDVQVPKDLLGGDVIKANKVLYHKRQAEKLLRLMPLGYTLLPGSKHIAYRLNVVDGAYQVHTLIPKATTESLTERWHGLQSTALIYGEYYLLSPCGTRLYRQAHTEDLFLTEDFLAAQAEVFDALRPRDKPVLPALSVWYEVTLGPPPAVRFHEYKGRVQMTTSCPIVQSQVSYQGNTYKVSAHGLLNPV